MKLNNNQIKLIKNTIKFQISPSVLFYFINVKLNLYDKVALIC